MFFSFSKTRVHLATRFTGPILIRTQVFSGAMHQYASTSATLVLFFEYHTPSGAPAHGPEAGVLNLSGDSATHNSTTLVRFG
jgi:hypothetical protein